MKIYFLIVCLIVPFVKAKLQLGFYDSTCPNAEKIVQKVVKDQFNADITTTAALVRLHFHDCFVHGCDASILIDSTDTDSSEKDLNINKSLRGFEIIDKAKKGLESVCPEIVSCADIITLAARDSIALAGGRRYNVSTGRRDGLTSNPILVNLPQPSDTVPEVLVMFKNKGFNVKETVTLLGAHTVGVAHCNSFSDRLFRSNGKPDPTMDRNLASNLVKTCSGKNPPSVFLDQSTWLKVDNEYYKEILQNRGILQVDQDIVFNNSTAPIVSTYAKNAAAFQVKFSKVMVKMGKLDVIVGNDGEIRKNCRAFNT